MVKAVKQGSDADDLSSLRISGRANDVIYEEDKEGAEMFVIESGQVELSKTFGGETRQIAQLGPGDFFGEMSLLEDQPRESSARAVSDYQIVKIDASTFDQLIQENPEIAIRMLRKLSHRLMMVHEAESRALRIAEGPIPLAPREPKPATGQASFLHEPTGKTFKVKSSGVTRIGRYDSSAEYEPDVDLISIGSDTISRRHALVRVRDGDFLLQEESARNGTFVNGEKLKKGQMKKLQGGDEVVFGTLKTVFRVES